jgi:putative copper export protein
MPNWLHLLFNGLDHLGLALWIGGAVALGALVAPVLFGALPRPQAGAIFGPALRRFAMLRLFAVGLMIVGAGGKHLLFESFARSPWIALRWLLIAILTIVVVYEITVLHPAMERLRGDPEFQRLHKRSEALMKVSLVVAVMALFVS